MGSGPLSESDNLLLCLVTWNKPEDLRQSHSTTLAPPVFPIKIATLEESKTFDWWKQVKLLMGTSSDSLNEMQVLAIKCTNGDMDILVNSMNGLFLPLCEYLQSSHQIFDADEPLPVELIISVTDTEVTLKKANVNKATTFHHLGVDRVSHLLVAPVTTLFNSSHGEGVLPKLWKSATVIPLPKKHPPDTVEHYIIPISKFGGMAGTCTTDVLNAKVVWHLYFQKDFDKKAASKIITYVKSPWIIDWI